MSPCAVGVNLWWFLRELADWLQGGTSPIPARQWAPACQNEGSSRIVDFCWCWLASAFVYPNWSPILPQAAVLPRLGSACAKPAAIAGDMEVVK